MDRQITINTPLHAKIVVSKGTPIGHNSTLYTISDTEDLVIPISNNLGIRPEEIFKFTTRVIGDKIARNDILAQKKGLLGTKKVLSPVEGILSSISHDNGEITISVEKSASEAFNSPVEGTVVSIDKNRGSLVVTIPAGTEIDAEIISDTAGGKISYIDMNNSSATATQIKNKVIVVENLTPALASKFDALDGLAIVYLNGTHTSELKSAKVKNKAEFDKIATLKKENIVLLPTIKKIIVY